MAIKGANVKKQGGGKAPPRTKKVNDKTLGYLDVPRASTAAGYIYAKGIEAAESRFNPADRLLPADEYYVMSKNKLSNEDEAKVHVEAVAAEPTFAGVDINMLSAVVGIPPIADNIADPPGFNDIAALSGGVKGFKTGRVGKEYTRRVLERGQFLTLTPLELKPDLGDATLMAIGHVTGVQGNFHKAASMIDRLSIGSYGYKTQVATKRYWRSVVAHMKVAMFSLGIDDLRSDRQLLNNYLSRYLPAYMIQFLIATGDLNDIKSIVSGNAKEESEEAQFREALSAKAAGLGTEDSGSSGGGGDGLGDGAKPISGFSPKAAFNKIKNMVSSAQEMTNKITDFNNKHGFTGGNSTSSATTGGGPVSNNEGDTLPAQAMYATEGFGHLLRHVTNIDIQDPTASTLPFTVFYVNGPIDRQMSFSLDLQPSTISHASITGGKKLATGAVSTLSGLIAKGLNDKAGIGLVSETLGGIEPLANEWAYHSQGGYLNSMLVSNILVPKVMTGGSTDTTYTIPVREVTVSSDRFSLLRPAMAWALLAPYVLQTTMPRREIIIPTAALYCAAFSKGVINAPRAVITNLQIKTDTAFQTTFGAPTELDFTITLQPLYTVSTTPDFNRYWGTGDLSTASSLIGAMWNPMSSMNILATMCGQNTVLTGVPLALTEVFIKGRVESAWNSIKGTYSNFRATLRDYKSSFKLAKSNAKYI